MLAVISKCLFLINLKSWSILFLMLFLAAGAHRQNAWKKLSCQRSTTTLKTISVCVKHVHFAINNMELGGGSKLCLDRDFRYWAKVTWKT